jgi:hypothetical protein
MRTRIILALALCAAAAPLHAQKDGPVYHGAGYEVVLPARYRLINTRNTVRDGQPMSTVVFGNGDGMVMVIRSALPHVDDTTLVTRRAMLQLARAGMQQAGDGMRLDGEPADILRDDRVTLRVPIVFENKGESVRGTADISVSRRGRPVLWVLIAVHQGGGRRGGAAGARALDTFRLTGDDDGLASADDIAAKDELAIKP